MLMNIKNIIIFPIVTFFLVCSSSFLNGSTQYLEILGKEEEYLSNWEFSEKENNIKIISGNTLLDNVYIETRKGTTILWKNTRKKEDTNFTAKRENNTISVNGIIKGEAINKSFPVNDYPWFQTPGFLLKPFILSDQTSIQFILLRASSAAPILMEVSKIKEETLTIEDTTYDCIKIEMYPPSFLKYFWKAPMWFDKHTGNILKYDGLLGGPGSDTFKIIYSNK